nr:MAG TPA: hypothetical protein [Caudoviricetes sp.]
MLNVSPCGSSQLSEAYEKTGRSLFFSFAFASCGGGGGANINGTFICHIRSSGVRTRTNEVCGI